MLVLSFCFGVSLYLGASHTASAHMHECAEFKRMEFNTAWVQVGGKSLKVELADNWDLRAQGLMCQRELCEDCGMLFKFDRRRMISMWMRNTLIPLDVAYFEKTGKIIDIRQMQPLDLTSVPSTAPVSYALEMNEGWFAKNGVKEGDSIAVSFSGSEESKRSE